MLTESQKRALRAKTLLDMGGHDPKTVARECGYTSVNAMLGAIAMCDGLQEEKSPFPARASVQAVAREEHAKMHGARKGVKIVDEMPPAKLMREAVFNPKVKVYPVESGIIWFRKEDIAISYRPSGKNGPTVHINDESGYRRSGHPRWMALVGKDIGGKPALARALRQISEAASECAALIEDEIKGGR